MLRHRWAAAVTATALCLLAAGAAGPAEAHDGRPDHHLGKGFTFAVIGDIPYGQAEIDHFPANIRQINADRDVQWVSHLGDIKNGSSVCSDEYFDLIKSDVDVFEDPFVYTIGDNEWTDCHRPNNGGYNPLERLDAVRDVFFPRPGYTLGKPTRVTSDAVAGYPENVRYVRDGVSFAAVHIVGSNNSLAPWTGNTTATPEQTVEVLGRTADAVSEIHAAFAKGHRRDNRAVVLMTQADMFDPTATDPKFGDYYAFQPIVAAIARESRAYGGPVYLFNGDSHLYNADRPLAPGSPWLDFYGLTSSSAPNLQRITVDGSDNANDYLKVTVTNNRREPLRWTRIAYTS
ncbi:hypothetical protein GCM10022204_36220 [Microlunatus aurantiacus]|uniref:Calcineurin-like phosphoesterase n=1 Tax=Microlunatus aurantiacus TaxID=446786 RepID=A0ABP7E464_9ACTN